MSKDPLFSTCDIMKLRRMQNQDPDDGVSNPTHLAVKPDSNRFRKHPRHRSEAVARSDLKIPRSAKPKSSDALWMERASICASQSAQEAIWDMRIGS